MTLTKAQEQALQNLMCIMSEDELLVLSERLVDAAQTGFGQVEVSFYDGQPDLLTLTERRKFRRRQRTH